LGKIEQRGKLEGNFISIINLAYGCNKWCWCIIFSAVVHVCICVCIQSVNKKCLANPIEGETKPQCKKKMFY
jgi:hypothetical protein